MTTIQYVHDLPHIAWLGESDFELRGEGELHSIWSNKAQKGVDYRGEINPSVLDQLQATLRLFVAEHQRDHVKLLRFFAERAMP